MSKIRKPRSKRDFKRRYKISRNKKRKVTFAPKPTIIPNNCSKDLCSDIKKVQSRYWERRILDYVNRLKRFCGLSSNSNYKSQDSNKWNNDLKRVRSEPQNNAFNSIATLKNSMKSNNMNNILNKKQAYKIVESALGYGMACGVVRKIGSGYKCLKMHRNYSNKRKRKDYSAAKTIHPRTVCTKCPSCRCYKCRDFIYKRKAQKQWPRNASKLTRSVSSNKWKHRKLSKSKSKVLESNRHKIEKSKDKTSI